MTMQRYDVAVYACGAKFCKSRGVQWEGMTPQQYRQATGGAVCCPTCGRVVSLVQIKRNSEAAS